MTMPAPAFIVLAFAAAMVAPVACAGETVSPKMSVHSATPKIGAATGALHSKQGSANANGIALEHIKLKNEGWERDTTTSEPAEK